MPRIAQSVLLPLTSIAEFFHQIEECIIFITVQSLKKVISAVHPETIPTSTVAMSLVLHLCIYNKQYILKLDYLSYSIAKKLRLFQKIDSERNLFFIFNCYKVEFRQFYADWTPNFYKIVCFKSRQLLYHKLHCGRLAASIHLLKLCQTRLKITLAQ